MSSTTARHAPCEPSSYEWNVPAMGDARAELAFNLCEPENRLVARSLEQRWEAKLAAVAEAEAGLQAQTAQRSPLPNTPDLHALAADLRRLWNEPTTSPRDRKHILRTLITDVTLISDPSGNEIRIGIRLARRRSRGTTRQPHPDAHRPRRRRTHPAAKERRDTRYRHRRRTP